MERKPSNGELVIIVKTAEYGIVEFNSRDNTEHWVNVKLNDTEVRRRFHISELKTPDRWLAELMNDDHYE